jgi:hypothetical protein
MSNGANRAPQEIRILLAVLPETNCQGFFHQKMKALQRKNISATELYAFLLLFCWHKQN